MASKNWDYVGRKPRHLVADADLVAVRLGREGGTPEECLDAELVDFARNGARLRIVDSAGSAWLAEGARAVLHVRSLRPGVDIGLPGTVRWRRGDGPGLWLIGCEFDQEVPLETLGELFLNEILSDGQ
jgi:PilZ domain-containing protein